jgi:hypothetical protein
MSKKTATTDYNAPSSEPFSLHQKKLGLVKKDSTLPPSVLAFYGTPRNVTKRLIINQNLYVLYFA